ncbi:hypothetical protein QJS04_geneDACA002564 [Acorus gramineus]|uniref:Uncharacterized protein n=1 Tax=Acorus gramineus TaxID=55184 RepID=A0AAV9APA8_ACOGR|nr:hypothetical protein QJS04_geneDACA002564 [Acorus gramineus]
MAFRALRSLSISKSFPSQPLYRSLFSNSKGVSEEKLSEPISGNVRNFIHPTAIVHPEAVLGQFPVNMIENCSLSIRKNRSTEEAQLLPSEDFMTGKL